MDGLCLAWPCGATSADSTTEEGYKCASVGVERNNTNMLGEWKSIN
jgi:hypothetical protein